MLNAHVKISSFRLYGVNAVVMLKLFGVLFSIDISVLVKSLPTKPTTKVKMSIDNKTENSF
jgi:hypothetical protein